jgi:hypothetical protein
MDLDPRLAAPAQPGTVPAAPGRDDVLGPAAEPATVELYWIPLGAGGVRTVQLTGRLVEGLLARRQHRAPCTLYHAALVVHLAARSIAIEMAPAWRTEGRDERGVVATGPVGLAALGRSRWFRYEVRCWAGGAIPDLAEAVGGPHRLDLDPAGVRRLVGVLPEVPRLTWGRDEVGAGEMWNSNSVVAWALARSGHDPGDGGLPPGGRAPGWDAGRVVAARGLAGPIASGRADRVRG